MREVIRGLVLIGGILGLLGCASLPAQPDDVQPYALLVLPEAIRLLGFDAQNFDPRLRIREMRLTPGPHSLRLAYAGSSPQHADQQADPLRLDTQAGHQYLFEAKT